MKIVLVDPSSFTPQYDHCLANALVKHGSKVVLATHHVPEVGWERDILYECWEVFYRIANKSTLVRFRTYLKGCEHPVNMRKLMDRLHRWKPDVIHFQWVPFPLVDRFFLRSFKKIAPLVLTVHDTEPFHGSPSSRLQLIGIRSAYSCFDHYVVHTQYSKEMLIKALSLPEERVSVIPHGVFDYYRELASNLLLPSEKKKVLFLGALKPYKGVDILIQAFARLPKELMEDTVLLIVGYPKMPVERLKTLAHQLGIDDHVLWDLRFVEEAEVAAYFSQADVVVLPYRRIDQSGVLMIALAFGKPIIASRVGGFAEILEDGRHALLVEPRDVDALTEALTCILSDDGLRIRMGKEVERLATNELSWDNIAVRTIQLYDRLLETKSTG